MTFPQTHVDGEVWNGAAVTDLESRSALAIDTVTINNQTADYTLQISDRGQAVTLNSAASVNLKVPTNASVAFPIGTSIEIVQLGVGTVTISAVTPATTTVNSLNNANTITGQYAAAVLTKTATDTWLLGGALGASAITGALPSTGTVGAPTAGTWSTAQLAMDSNHGIWKCLSGGTPGTWTRVGPNISPQDFGAKGDAIWVTDAAMSSSSATLTCATSLPFTSTAVDGGKLVCVVGAGAAGATLVTTISTVSDTAHATLAATASTGVSSATCVFGTDDTAAIRSWLSVLPGAGLTGTVTARHMTATGATPFNATGRSSLVIQGQGGGSGSVTFIGTSPGYNNPHLASFPNVAFINTSSGSQAFFSLTDSQNAEIDGVAIMNAHSAYTGTLLDWSASAFPVQRPGVRRAYVGGIDAKVIATGQKGVNTQHAVKGLLADATFSFIDVGWLVCTSAANAMEARGCSFHAYGTAGAQNPAEATSFISCEFGLLWGGGSPTNDNQYGVALNTTAGYQGWDAGCVFMNCHFDDSYSSATHGWIMVNQPANSGAAPYYGGVAVLGGYWGNSGAYALIYCQSNFDCVYVAQYGLTYGTANYASLVNQNGHTVTSVTKPPGTGGGGG